MSKPDINMSPMIDLVFLLLIFFMIASTLITYQKDPGIDIPIARNAVVPELIQGRVIVNVDDDGAIRDEFAKTLSLDQVEQIMANALQQNPNTRLHLRVDAKASHKMIKDVIAASARGGVNDLVFSTLQVKKR
jgi:biopolymer transport protein ExbD